MAKNKKRKPPVRQVKKNPAPPKKPEGPKVEETKPKETEPVNQEPQKPIIEKPDPIPDNIVQMPTDRNLPTLVEDPVIVFQLCMLESDMARLEVQQQLLAARVATKVAQMIADRDSKLQEMKDQFNELAVRRHHLREEAETKHKINLKNYVYEDVLGAFKLIPEMENQNAGADKGEN